MPIRQLSLSIENNGGGYADIFTFAEDGIVIRDNLSWEEYQNGLRFFKGASEKIKLGFSQYTAYGNAKFGDKMVQAAFAQLEFNMPDVKEAVLIASVPMEIRHPNLTCAHYSVLAKAKLTKPQLKKWAKVAVAQQLEPSTLKASIEAGEVVPKAVAQQRTHGLLTVNGIKGEFDIWLTRVGGIEGIREMETKEEGAIKSIIDLLQPIADLVAELKKPAKKAKAKKTEEVAA